MKGFYIYEAESRIGTEVDCLEISNIDHTFTHQIDSGTLSEEVKMHALVSKGTKTKCSPDDTYDFEVGALIALMKMCGLEKVVRACNEAFPKERYNTYIAKLEGELRDLKKDFNKVRDLKDFYKKNYEDVKEHYDKLGDRNKYLIDDINKKLEYIKEKDEEIKKLKSDKDKSWKNYQRNIQKKQDRINELNNIEEGYIKLREEYDSLFEEKEKLQHEYNLCLNSENALKYTVDSLNKSVDKLNKAIVGYKNDLYNTAKRCKELERGYKASNDDEAKLVEYYQREIKKLEAENEKLKLDCEKLQHGYVDTDNVPSGHWDGDILDIVFLPGRACGKQYKALVELFKKIDQKKVDAAYKEAYGKRVIWCSSQSSTRDMLDSLLDSCKYAIPSNNHTEWLYKIPTKREKKWERILKLHKENDVIIEVKKEDVTTFLHELEDKIPEITWASDNKIFETKYTMKDIYFELKTHDRIYFRLSKKSKLSYSSDPNTYLFKNLDIISYLPPMRWDLFEKGRLVVKVSKENYAEFCSRVLSHFDKVGVNAFNHDCKFGYFMFNKDTYYAERILASDNGDAKEINRHKVIDWEDVR